MHPYIPHLLTDIAAAHRTEVPEEEYVEQSIEEYFEEVEKWISGEDPPDTFGYYCGLKSEDFPPAEQLTDQEMKMVRKAFEKMMFTWNLGIDLPEKLPIEIAYRMTVETLDTKTNIVNSGMLSFDFCTGYAPDCIFKEYCPCLEIWNREDNDDMDGFEQEKGKLPF